MDIKILHRQKTLEKCGKILENNSRKIFDEWMAKLMEIATGIRYPAGSRFTLSPQNLYNTLARSKYDYNLAFTAFSELMISNGFLLE